MKVLMSCDEWYPVYDIDKVADNYKVEHYYQGRVVDMDEDTYIVYKGLLLQFEKLQDKLEKQWKGAK